RRPGLKEQTRCRGGHARACLARFLQSNWRDVAARRRTENPPRAGLIGRAARHINRREEQEMARGDKSKYTDKQKRKAEHIAEGYEDRGTPAKEAKRRAWATVNKESGGGKKSGSGRSKPESHVSSKKGGKIGGAASAARSAEERSASAKKAART